MAKHFVLILPFLIAANLVAAEDPPEYGNVAELKGVKRFYVDAGPDVDLRDIIKRRLEELPNIKVTDASTSADVWIVFRWYGDGPFWARTVVVKAGLGRRLLFTSRNKEAELDDLADDAAKAVAKAYRQANEAR
jgi:hypothetical protein